MARRPWSRPVPYLVATLLALGLTACARAEPPHDEASHDSDADAAAQAIADAEAASASALMRNLARTLGILEEKMVALADAMPEEQWDWRPTEGVRSVRDVYTHAAADNWFVAALMGAEVPPETGITTDGATVGAYEARGGSKEEVVPALEASFALMRHAMESSLGDSDRAVDLRGSSITAGDLWVRAIVHLHEHLGQSIAYARMNGVVPPWTR